MARGFGEKAQDGEKVTENPDSAFGCIAALSNCGAGFCPGSDVGE